MSIIRQLNKAASIFVKARNAYEKVYNDAEEVYTSSLEYLRAVEKKHNETVEETSYVMNTAHKAIEQINNIIGE